MEWINTFLTPTMLHKLAKAIWSPSHPLSIGLMVHDEAPKILMSKAQVTFLSLLLPALALSLQLQAQSVFLPDTNLRVWFDQQAPGCVDAAGWFDPNNELIQTDTSFTLVINWPSCDLTGIGALPNARYLAIGTLEQLGPATIEAFPDSLRRLVLEDIPGLVQLPDLPDRIEQIEFRGLPDLFVIGPWPTSLRGLDIETNFVLDSLPDFSSGLAALSLIDMTELDVVPPLDPELGSLWVKHCPQLSELPDLPIGISNLWLTELPLLTEYPMWPDSLVYLRLEELNVPSPLQPFPDKMELLVIQWNPLLSDLPAFGEHLASLTVTNCPLLTHVPDRFPTSLSSVELTFCPLVHCLPWLHDDMYMYVEFSGIDCLPNVPQNDFTINPVWLRQRPCIIYGPTCTAAAISGTTYADQDSDSVFDPGEAAHPYATLEVQPGGSLCGSDSAGKFMLNVGPGSYSINALTDPYVSSISPIGGHTAYLQSCTDQDSLNDFGFITIPNMQDLRVDFYTMPPRSGFVRSGWLTLRNVGTLPVPATATLVLDTVDQFLESEVSATSISGQTITWDLGTLQPGMQQAIVLSLRIPAGTPMGTPLEHTATVSPIAGDLYPADNVIAFQSFTINGLDPNDKSVFPDNLTPSEVQNAERLTYSIRFQNTGNSYAERIVVIDTLSPDLQWSSFQFLSSSHATTWSLEHGVLVFVFDGIYLPDSGTDELNSHGFVRFNILPSTTLQLGDHVTNVADIYFDFNEPVITEAAIVSIAASTQVDEKSGPALRVFPDPVEDLMFINFDSWGPGSQWSIADASGKLMRSGDVTEHVAIEVRDLANGAYMLRIVSNDRVASGRFIKL